MFDLNSQPHNNPNMFNLRSLPRDNPNHLFNDWGGFGRKSQSRDNYRRRFATGGIGESRDNYRHRFDTRGSGGGNGGDQFRLETMEEDSGVCSPPLWRRTSPPGSPIQSRHHHHNHPRSLSPTSRTQAIERGQQELMEMVRNMAETSYELSLKDIVEQRRDVSDASVDETQSMEKREDRSNLGGGQSQRWKEGSVKRQETRKKVRIMIKNESFDQNKRLLINMLPFNFGSKKKSNKCRNNSSLNRDYNVGVKVSPKPALYSKYEGGRGGGGDHRDWLWKMFVGSSDNECIEIMDSSCRKSTDRSDSSGSSVRSNSFRKKGGCIPGCWPFFPARKKNHKFDKKSGCKI